MRVTVQDVNDNSPIFLDEPYIVHTVEGMATLVKGEWGNVSEVELH